MTELFDYSGEFDPDFSHENLSKETLIGLLEAYSDYILKIDGFWYLKVMEQWGNDEARECDIRVLERGKQFELKAITELLKIEGDDVAALMRYMQVNPWTHSYGYEIDLKSNDHAILTHHTCPTLAALEKEGKGREARQCQEVDARFFRVIADFFNPDMQIIPIKVPPRTDYSDVCCVWEFKLERQERKGL